MCLLREEIMFDLRKSIRIALIPIIGLTILEVIWNLIERIYILSLISPILYLVKFAIYGYCGYIAYTKHSSTIVEGAATGAVAGFVFACIEGLIVSLVFTGTFFYNWGSESPLMAAISTIVTQMLYGIIFSSIGVYITPRYLTSRAREVDIETKDIDGKHVRVTDTFTSDLTHGGDYYFKEDADLELDFSQRKRVYKGLYGDEFDKELTEYIENKKNIRTLRNYVFNYSSWSGRERAFHGEIFSDEFREGLDNILNDKTLAQWLKEKVDYFVKKYNALTDITEPKDEDIGIPNERNKGVNIIEYVKNRYKKLMKNK